MTHRRRPKALDRINWTDLFTFGTSFLIQAVLHMVQRSGGEERDA
jgi:hypothetical protein